MEKEELVYYVSYGSNTLYERFIVYIKGGYNKELEISQIGCTNKSLPKSSIPYEINHSIYFANKSSKWNNEGVAFLDITKPGHSLGRAYLITKSQLHEVHQQEGDHPNWYNKLHKLGDIDGKEVYTITNSGRLEDNKPGIKYINVIIRGLKQIYKKEIVENYIKDFLI